MKRGWNFVVCCALALCLLAGYARKETPNPEMPSGELVIHGSWTLPTLADFLDAGAIVHGVVAAKSETKYGSLPEYSLNDYLYSDVTISVTEWIAGNGGDTVSYQELGGTLEDFTFSYEGAETVEVGQEVIVELSDNGIVADYVIFCEDGKALDVPTELLAANEEVGLYVDMDLEEFLQYLHDAAAALPGGPET